MLARLRKSKDDEGFTLIELLVVIIIIGILAAIAIPVFLNQRKKGVDAGLKSDIRQVANEMESAFTDTQTYPATVTVKKTSTNVLQIAVHTDGTGYCVSAYNTNGTANAATLAYWYVSTDGGLKGVALAAKPALCTGTLGAVL